MSRAEQLEAFVGFSSSCRDSRVDELLRDAGALLAKLFKLDEFRAVSLGASDEGLLVAASEDSAALLSQVTRPTLSVIDLEQLEDYAGLSRELGLSLSVGATLLVLPILCHSSYALVATQAPKRAAEGAALSDANLPILGLFCSQLSAIVENRELRDAMSDRSSDLAVVTDALSVAQERIQDLDTRLAESKRAEVVAALATGVAHDFNNLLAVIASHAHLIREEAKLPKESVFDVEQILDATRRATEIAGRLTPAKRTSSKGPDSTSFNAAQNTATVLVVEDDEQIRNIARRALRKSGFHVIAAEDSASALELASDLGSDLHMLVTDLSLPGINGVDLATAVREQCGDVPVLFVSGYFEAGFAGNGMQAMAVLEKPFRPEQLVAEVKALTRDGLVRRTQGALGSGRLRRPDLSKC